ncbi:MAG: PQQ-binding-like beta-propeller repeat protein [Elusimicrobia bacterium]|nr:PQQ-binding-like beta-propeller repeat protein [Elusimicrobiota bacterium]
MRHSIIGLLFLTICVPAAAKKENEPLVSRLIWEHEFSGAMTQAELLAHAGLLHIVAREGMKKPQGVKKEDWPKKRYLLSSGGEIIWQADAKTTALLADNPFAVVMEGSGQAVVLRALNPEGKPIWILTLPEGLLISKLAVAQNKTLYLAFLPVKWLEDPVKSYEAKIMALNLDSGQPYWTAGIGPLRQSADQALPEMVVYDGLLWWVGGGLVFVVEPSGGRILWQAAISENFKSPAHWAFGEGAAFISNEEVLWAFSGRKGLLWRAALPQKEKLQTMARGPSGLACSMGDSKRLRVWFLNPGDGKLIWEETFKHAEKKLGPAPRGFAITQDRLILAADGKLFGLNSASGETVFETSVKKKVFQQGAVLRPARGHFILTGPEGAYAYSPATGQLLWEHSDFIEPVAETRKLRQATLQVGFDAAYSGYSQEASDAWSDYHRGAKSYASASAEAHYAQMRHNAEASAKALQSAENLSKGLTGAIEIDLALANQALGSRYASFYRHRGMKIGFVKAADNVDVALLDLEAGELQDLDIPKAHSACVSQVLVDPARRQIYQAFRQMALMCKDENKLHAFQY